MQSRDIAIAETLAEAAAAEPNNAVLKEAWDQVRQMLGREDVGWDLLYGGGSPEDKQFGLRLQDLKEWGGRINPAVTGTSWIGAGFRRRAHYIWQNGIRYGNIPGSKDVEPTRGKKNIQDIIDRDGNQMHFFGDSARRAREQALYAEGIAFWIGNETTKDLEAIPLWQITDELTEPNGLGYAWAYLRQWSERDLATGEVTPRKRWYFTDRFVSKRVKTVSVKGDPDPTPVDMQHVIFDMHANRATGLVYGSPDAVAAWIWNGIARDATMDGRDMQRALAIFALKATAKTKDGADNAAMKLATAEGAGNMTSLGGGQDLSFFSTAGKGYDFSSLNFLVSIVATSLDLSLIDITADPGSAGASYNAGQLMGLPTRLAMEARRADHVELDKRVLKWMGVVKPEVAFVPFATGEETYRAAQGILMGLEHDVYSRQETRDQLDDLFARPNGKVPSEDQRPSVLLAKATAKVTPKPAAAGDAPSGGGKQVASPSQGKSSGVGGQGSAKNDVRRDGGK